MIAGVFDDPGRGIDWIALIQIFLAFALLSVCCWLIGATTQARWQHRYRQRPTDTAAPAPPRLPAVVWRRQCHPLTESDSVEAAQPPNSVRHRSITEDLS